jgi:hypothetical protein
MATKTRRVTQVSQRSQTAGRRRTPDTSLARKSLVLGGLLMGLLLSALGIILLRTGMPVPGAAAVLVGPVLFLVASKRIDTLTFTGEDLPSLLRTWIPAALMLTAGFLCIVSAYDVAHRSQVEKTQVAINAWAASLICLVIGVYWYERWTPRFQEYRTWLAAHLYECLGVAAVMVVAIAARMLFLDQHPYPWSGDEATVGTEALGLVSSPYLDIFNSGWSGNPFPAFFPTGILEVFFGPSIFTVRAASALAGILTVFFLYLLARELFDRRVAIIAAAFLSTFPYHLQFSRVGVMTIQDPLVVSLTLWLVVRAARRPSMAAFLWAGIATGLTFYTYVGGRLVLVLAFAAVFFVAILQRGYLKTNLRPLAVYLLATAVTIAPMAVFFAVHVQDFFSRYNQVAIVPSGWLAAELAQPGKTLWGVMLNQFAATTLAYIGWNTGGNFYNSPQPYLTIVGSLFFLIGMGVVIQRWRQPASLIMLSWFWLVVFVGGVLTITPPASTRIVMTIPALAIFVAIGIIQLLDVLAHFRVTWPVRRLIAALVVIGLVLHGAYYYFGPYRAGAFFDDANGEVAMHVAQRLAKLGPDYTLVMIGAPRMFSDFPTIPFVAPGSRRADIVPEEAESAELTGLLPTYLVATPNNLAALQAVAWRYPGGAWETVPSQTRPETLYYGYVTSAVVKQAAP